MKFPKILVSSIFFFLFLVPNIGQTQQAINFSKKSLYKIAHANIQDKLRLASHTVPDSLSKRIEKQFNLRSNTNTNMTQTVDEAESEVHAALNPNDSNNIVAATMSFSSGASALNIHLLYTLDGGLSWQVSDFAPFEEAGALLRFDLGGGDPVLAFSPDGTITLSFLTLTFDILGLGLYTRMHYATSTDKGISWTYQGTAEEATQIEFFGETAESRFLDKEWIAVDNSDGPNSGTLYMSYVEIDFTDTSYQVFLERKVPGAAAFDTIRTDITQEEFVFAQFATIDVDDEGIIHMAFCGAREEVSFLKLYYCQSRDGGRTFSSPTEIETLFVPCFPAAQFPDCAIVGFGERLYPAPIIATDKSQGPHRGNIYISYTGTIPDSLRDDYDLDVFLKSSSDGGNNWTTPISMGMESERLSHQYFSSLSVSNTGKLVIAWYDRRNDPNNLKADYFISYSDDGGLSFPEELPITTAPTDFSTVGLLNNEFGVGEYNQVIVKGNTIIPIWADGRGNDGNLDIFTAQVDLDGNLSTQIQQIQSISGALQEVSIFPNPIDNQFNISSQFTKQQFIRIILYDMAGRPARRLFEGSVPPGDFNRSFVTRGLPAGQYFRSITGADSFFTQFITLK